MHVIIHIWLDGAKFPTEQFPKFMTINKEKQLIFLGKRLGNMRGTTTALIIQNKKY